MGQQERVPAAALQYEGGHTLHGDGGHLGPVRRRGDRRPEGDGAETGTFPAQDGPGADGAAETAGMGRKASSGTGDPASTPTTRNGRIGSLPVAVPGTPGRAPADSGRRAQHSAVRRVEEVRIPGLPRGSGNDDVRRRWGALWVDFAIQANRMFPEPLGEREVSKTAASVSRWTWTNPEFGRGGDDGRRDPAEQSKRGVVSGVVRRLRVRPRNARTVELHRREGLGLRAIARIVEVSPSTVWRTLEADKLNPGYFINQSPPRGENGVDGEEIEGNDEKRNNFATALTNGNRQKQPLQQSETANLAEKSYYIQPSSGPPPTSSVDNSGGGVDNPLSAWEEAIREGARRRPDESRRRAERGPRSWMDRGPPEE